MKKVALGLLAWMVLSVPLGILVGKVLKANREAWEREGPPEPPEWVNRAAPVNKDHRVFPVHQENGENPEFKVIKDRSVQPDP